MLAAFEELWFLAALALQPTGKASLAAPSRTPLFCLGVAQRSLASTLQEVDQNAGGLIWKLIDKKMAAR
jgi:hypothetical protein